MLDLFHEIDGRLRWLMVRYPELYPKLQGIQKHLGFAVDTKAPVDLRKYGKDARGRMIALVVDYPDLEAELFPLVNKLSEELELPRI